MSKLVVKLRRCIKLSRAVNELDIILRVRDLDSVGLAYDFVVDHIVILCGLGAHFSGFSKLLFPVLLVSAANRSHKWFAGLELSDCSVELSYGNTHTLGGLDCQGVFMLG